MPADDGDGAGLEQGPRSLAGRRVLLGVSGGIAAYKAALVVRRLREAGADVRCVLTRAAESFVAPLTLEVLTGHPVWREEYLEANDSGVELHIEAAQWADLLCVAPCTTHTLARLALGLADDFLTTTALAFDGPVVLAPAMHQTMWQRTTTQQHAQALEGRGVVLLGPGVGALASGEQGVGRMVEPEDIVRSIVGRLARGSLVGRRVVVSAGPTREAIDPVRFLSNRSSGKMGFALAAEAARRGAATVLVAGPVALQTPGGVERLDVESAHEMRDAVYASARGADLVILCAAVADFRPVTTSERKLKKQSLHNERSADGLLRLALELEENPDILAGLAQIASDAVRVGFAAETEDLLANAADKLERKQVDFLVANDVSRSDIGFGTDCNEVLVLRRGAEPVHLPLAEKTRLAVSLLDLFAERLPRIESS